MGTLIANRKKIIITTDDFGISDNANKLTFDLLDLGKIDRVSIMINGTITDEDVGKLINSGVRLDLHLDIQGSSREEKGWRKSAILRSVHFLLRYITGSLSTTSIKRSWANQLSLFHKRFGKYPDGINAHEHIHFFPPYFKTIRSLQEEYSIPYVRFGKLGLLGKRNITSAILDLVHKINFKRGLPADMVSSDYLVSLDWIDDLKHFLDNLPQGTIEIVCHPQREDEYSKLLENF